MGSTSNWHGVVALLIGCTPIAGMPDPPDAATMDAATMDAAPMDAAMAEAGDVWPLVDRRVPGDAPRAACLGAALNAPGSSIPEAPVIAIGAFAVGLVPIVREALRDGDDVYLGGYTATNATQRYNDAFVARVDLSGRPDTSWGDRGITRLRVIPQSPAVLEVVTALARDDAARVVAAGIVYPAAGTTARAFVARLTPDGAVDTTFGAGGFVLLSHARGFYAADLLVDARGIVVVGGASANPDTAGAPGIIARVTQDGVLDSSFGVDGFVVVAPPVARISAIVADGAGYVVATTWAEHPSLLRVLADGNVDTRWRAQGYSVHRASPLASVAMARQSNGAFVVLAIRQPDGPAPAGVQTLVRFRADGAPDDAFGNDGVSESYVATNSFQTGTNVIAVQCDDAILTGGSSFGNTGGIIHRRDRDGAFDPGFGTRGSASAGAVIEAVLPSPSGGEASVVGMGPSGVGPIAVSGRIAL